ncbi:uncharacterized protein [Dermacentor albipictus]|uniref:uncharacterized protein n=1 Tax=Dermacentor albipictus TaxID=60249 RepID=UPI0038FC140B
MFRRTGDRVELKNAAMPETGTSTSCSSSSSSSSSGSSGSDAFGRRRIARPSRRPGFRRLELHELHEGRQLQAAARGDGTGTALDPLALPELELMNQERNDVEVIVRRGNWYMNPRFQALLSATAILCSVLLLFYLGSTLRIGIKYRNLHRASTRRAYAERADLPLFSGCDEMACQLCMAAISTSINKSHDPCEDFYWFVCDGWKHQDRVLSVVDAAEDTMYERALNAIKLASQDSHNQAQSASSGTSVEKKVGALARSCVDISESSLQDLRRVMFERPLPWPERSRWDPLAILLDLSGNERSSLV